MELLLCTRGDEVREAGKNMQTLRPGHWYNSIHENKQTAHTDVFLSYPTLIAELHDKTSILFRIFTGGPNLALKQYLVSVQVKLS